MQLSDLKTFDPMSIKGFQSPGKKLTVDDVKNWVKTRKMEFAAILVAIAALIGVMQVYGFNSKKAADLQSQLAVLAAKEEPVAGYKKIASEKEAFFENLPPGLDEEDFIPAMTEVAKRHGISITNIVPPSSRDMVYYKLTTLSLECEATTYKGLMMFVYDLEHSEYSLRFENLVIRKSAETGVIQFSANLTSIKVLQTSPEEKGN